VNRLFARRKRWLSLLLGTGTALVLLLILALGSGDAFSYLSRSLYASEAAPAAGIEVATDTGAAQALLQRTLDRVQQARNYEIQVSMDQTLTPERTFFSPASTETAHFEIHGKISGPNRARLTIVAGRTSFGLVQQQPQEMLIAGDALYERRGDRWVRSQNTPPPGIGEQALSFAMLARDGVMLEPASGPPGLETLTMHYQRIGFKIHPEDVTRQLLARQGPMSEGVRALAELQMPKISGRGELWVTPSGYPDRLILNLSWVRHGEEPLHIQVTSETTYTGFNLSLPIEHFSPDHSFSDGTLLPEANYQRWLWSALSVVVALGFLFFLWLLRWAQSGARRALTVVTVLIIIALLIPHTTPVINAVTNSDQQSDQEENLTSGSKLADLFADVRQMKETYSFSAAAATALDAYADEDGDGLPNGYELTLGTNPHTPDTDFDGLTDAQEVLGIPCAGGKIYSDPINPDSNYDGLKDGDEFWRGQCHKGNTHGWIWDDDNDKDNVPDGLDLSPFSNSIAEGFLGGPYAGANFSFESLDMEPDPAKTVIYPFYVEVQIRPTNADSLRWAYKHLAWPGDNLGAIQNTDPVIRFVSELKGQPVGSSGKLTLVPFLSATVRQIDLPSAATRNLYGINYAPKKDDNSNPVLENGKQLYDLTIPLAPVERAGQIYAFQAKMLHDQNGNTNLERTWKDLRLKWALVGDVLMADDTGKAIPSPNGGYGLVVYDESYHVTGLQVSRQGGAAVMVAAAVPKDGVLYDDGAITLLRAGMEAKFLSGDLGMADIKQRFHTPTNATLEQRWGIPLDQDFHIK
jgi:hypothetical protein